MTDLQDSEPVFWTEILFEGRKLDDRTLKTWLADWVSYCEDLVLIIDDARGFDESSSGLRRAQAGPCSACRGPADSPEHKPAAVLFPAGIPKLAGPKMRLCPRCIRRPRPGKGPPYVAASRRSEQIREARMRELHKAELALGDHGDERKEGYVSICLRMIEEARKREAESGPSHQPTSLFNQ